MNDKRRVLAISGSYRVGGMTDLVVERLATDLRKLGADVEHIRLRDVPVEFCLNCRQCMQKPGNEPGQCVHDDGMADIVRKIEEADAFIFAAPTNFSAVTALFKRFAERLSVYGYWPWGKAAPVFRKSKLPKKPAIIVSSCAAPGLLGRLTYGTNQSLKVAARTVGGNVVGSMVTGMISKEPRPKLPRRTERRAHTLARKLAA